MGGGSAAGAGIRDEARRLLPQAMQAIEKRLQAYLRKSPRHRVHRLLAEIALEDRWPPSVRQKALELIRNEALRAAVEHLRSGKPLEKCVSVRRLLNRLERLVYEPILREYGPLVERHSPLVAGFVTPERVGWWAWREGDKTYITFWFKWSFDYPTERLEAAMHRDNLEYYADYEPVTLVLDQEGILLEVRIRIHYRRYSIPAEWLDTKGGRVVLYFAPIGHTPVPRLKPGYLERMFEEIVARSGPPGYPRALWFELTHILGEMSEALGFAPRSVSAEPLWGPPRRYNLRHKPLDTPWW